MRKINPSLLLAIGLILICSTATARPWEPPVGIFPPPQPAPPATGISLGKLKTIANSDWDQTAVRRVLQSFAFGGHASDAQIMQWSLMKPTQAIQQMLNFDPVNARLSAPQNPAGDAPGCVSLTDLQAYWSSEAASNPMRVSDRPYYTLLDENMMQLSPIGLHLVWARAMHTRGCNLFLHKTAFYLTNYHAAIHIQNAGAGLIRDYYDDTIAALTAGQNFIELMYNAAVNGAVAVAYGHALNYVDPVTGSFFGNDDFAREYFQLLFGIEGTTEDEDYHENVSIDNNALLLTGMLVDTQTDRFGSQSQFDWLLTRIDFTDHVDDFGRRIFNQTAHYDFRKGKASCLEILHQQICGATADEKLQALGPVAAAHPESMASIPLKIVHFFADTIISPQEASALQSAWIDANYDLLGFIRAYAISTLFHGQSTSKDWSAFERNLIIYNANLLDNEESFARPLFAGPIVRMFQQGALVFAPTRGVFGGQTGADAANDRFLFKNAWASNIENPAILGAHQEFYLLDMLGAVQLWQKDWSTVIPANPQGEYVVAEVAGWLWQRFIADGGKNFDLVAKAQVYSLLATGFDFAPVVDRNKINALYSSLDIGQGPAHDVLEQLAQMKMNFTDPQEQLRVGMAVNFISMMPYTFATQGHVK